MGEGVNYIFFWHLYTYQERIDTFCASIWQQEEDNANQTIKLSLIWKSSPLQETLPVTVLFQAQLCLAQFCSL